MKKIVYYEDKPKSTNNTLIEGVKFNIHTMTGIRNVVLFMINSNNVIGILCDKDNKEISNIDLMETVWSVTPFVLFILFKSSTRNTTIYDEFKDKIIWINSLEEIDTIESFTPSYMRKFNRINWPLLVHFSLDSTVSSSSSGNILSLSAGGAFIETEQLAGIQQSSNIYLIIEFKDFKLYVDSTVIRVNNDKKQGKCGFAVEFHHVSKLTQNCIDSIIKDKLASRLLFTIDDIFDTIT
ncbi:MAG: hypothetical protein A2015_04685 [Spirochaetes bacterium GWF1_31_7]|nr:MAG: hypothetical protein A2Y30_05065 [Spirochaetes bacterium GWE1_32_154]OHD48765.1 MAG: hypothetical protein A2Y29_03040 [Spirochaetes bacterium GWE2_31_10]OHD52828.1 MAG: hypothetical protein A2015_04685 [Spirochaetes bacterium GWF1_31_7]HBD95194.1 hypothetical protein [Spirochaetia bacterium]HBI37558.1 hypothetical protein [Spirochaetia bacterium]